MTQSDTIAVHWAAQSRNEKTGPIPVSMTGNQSCPKACPLAGGACYAKQSHLGSMWQRMSDAGPDAAFKHGRGIGRTIGWQQLVEHVAALPTGQLWRHNQAGDLPHNGEAIDRPALDDLTAANAVARALGFTYSHHAPTPHNLAAIAAANAGGFTVNLSANNLSHADELAGHGVGPVVVLLPASVHGNVTVATPEGRRVVVCPATYRDDVTCASCGLCAVATRKVIVGFPAHGAGKRKASEIAA